ncbi:tail fiber assembly protein [Escherichia coli]|uniref:tail fiber assembly protein n=1 Tax=Escherichia coli TaxID=562 RepID=UPI002A366BAC|nr:tail fiber assembly protein [Escherichia coli]HCA7195044.1 tail fiber assembly protein [Escherichia coli]
MSVYAVVNSDGAIVNTILWDGKSEWVKPKGMDVVLCSETEGVIGGTYRDGVFSPPPEIAPPKSESIAEAEQTRITLLSDAALAIAPLQDAVDLGIATADEQQELTEWKQYRVQVNRIDTSTSPDVVWPEKPQT